MKVRMLVGLSGLEYSLAPGAEWEFGEAEAARLIAAGIAERAELPAAPSPVERRGRHRKQDNVVPTDGDAAGE